MLDRTSVHLSSAEAKKYALSFAAKLMETRYILLYKATCMSSALLREASSRTLSAASWRALDMYGGFMSRIVRSFQRVKILYSD